MEEQPKISNKHFKIILLIAFIFILVLTEYALRLFFGFGNPILYDSNPLYGYRPLPNQEMSRFYGAKLKFNNLGIRSDEDWDNNINNKVLFLGSSLVYGGSYISNDELFSTLAVKNIKGFKSGCSGVNAWGVDNIYGLVMESKFLPAKTYVTVINEYNFYIGLNKINGTALWCNPPKWALKEVIFYFFWLENEERYSPWTNYVNDKEKEYIVEKTVIRFKEMDNFLKSKGYIHLIYISPSIDQVLNQEGKDSILLNLFKKHNLNVIYILDRINTLNLNKFKKKKCFHDNAHLEKEGDIIWGEIINDDLKKVLEFKADGEAINGL
jgi:hypothetical protein